MAVTIVDTAGAPNANSYASRAYADSFVQSTEFAASWAEADGSVKDIALVRATRLIDQLGFYGYVSSDTQSLQWPRTGVMRPSGAMYETTAVPVALREMSAYLAAYLVATASPTDATANPFTETDADNIASLSAGGLSLVFRENVGTSGLRWFEQAIQPTLAASGLVAPLGTVRLVR